MMLRTALLAVMVFASAPVVEAQSPEHLTIGLADAVTSVDPHFYNATPNHNLAMHVFDRLVDRTAAAEAEVARVAGTVLAGGRRGYVGVQPARRRALARRCAVHGR